MPLKQWFLAQILGCVSLLSCHGIPALEPVPPYVTVVTTPPRVSAGTAVSITLTNHSTYVLSFNPCSNVLLEVLTQDGWRLVADPKPCTEELRGVLPGTD